MSNLAPRLMVFLAHVIGGGSLLCLMFFLYLGRPRPIDLGLSYSQALVFDLVLCLVFFLQHSGMVRSSFQEWLGRFIPRLYHGSVYAVVSGAVLFSLIFYWQPMPSSLLQVEGPLRVVARLSFAVGILGFLWGVRSLGRFDGLGTRSLKARITKREPKEQPLTVRGAYRWVRHPLYTCVLVLLWSAPDLSADRLLLNVSWSVWIFVGSVLEERDLVARFGDPYREYQREVPMLLPVRIPKGA